MDEKAIDVLPGPAGLRMKVSPRSRWIAVEYEGAPYPIELRVGRAEDGRLICAGLQLAGDETDSEVTARSLREIPLARILLGVAAFFATAEVASTFRSTLEDMLGLKQAAVQPYHRVPTRPGPKGYPDDHFELVAAAYQRALIEYPRSTFKALATQLHASEATVRRWVQRAQDKGFIGESTPGKAGRKLPRGRKP